MVIFHCDALKKYQIRYRIIQIYIKHIYEIMMLNFPSRLQNLHFFNRCTQAMRLALRRSTDAEHRGLWLGHRTLHPALERGRQASLSVGWWYLYGVYMVYLLGFTCFFKWYYLVGFSGFNWDLYGLYRFQVTFAFNLWLFDVICSSLRTGSHGKVMEHRPI